MIFNGTELSESQIRTALYAVCLRIAPFYKDFSNKFETGNPNYLEECLSELEDGIIKKHNLDKICQKWIPKLEAIIPDMDDYNSELLPSLALDSVTATLTTLDFFLTHKPSLVDEVLITSLNSAEFIDESLNEFISIYKKPKKNAVSLEMEFIERIKNFVTGTPIDITEDLKNLISEYVYR